MKKIFTVIILIALFINVRAQNNCHALFAYNILADGAVSFKDSSFTNEPVISYTWQFGDGTSATGDYLTHTFNGPGPYLVCLSIHTMDSCYSTFCDTLYFGSNNVCDGFGTTVYQITNEPDSLQQIGIIAEAYNGTAPYTYAWSNNETTQIITVTVSNQEYCVTVTDNNGCTATDCYSAVIDTTPQCYAYFSYSFQNTNCGPYCGAFYGYGSSNASNTTQWTWSFGDGTSSSLQNPTHTFPGPGTYTVTLVVTDQTGCSATYTQTILLSNTMDCNGFYATISEVPNMPPTQGITLQANISGGTSPFTYFWNTGETTQTIVTSSANTYYCVTVTDANSCTTYACFYDSSSTCLDFSVIIYEYDSVNSGTSGTFLYAVATSSNSTGNVTYSWNNGINGQIINNAVEGHMYCVTATSDLGCTATACVVVSPDSTENCNGFFVTTYQVQDSLNAGGINIYSQVFNTNYSCSYLWSNGASTQNLIGVQPGEYCLTVTSANGCVAASCEYIFDQEPVDSIFTQPFDTCIVVVNSYIDTVSVLDSSNVVITWILIDENGNVTYYATNYTYDQTGNIVVYLTINCSNGNKGITTLSEVVKIEYNMILKSGIINDINKIALYPNPVKNQLNIDFSNNIDDVNYSICNAAGIKVMSGNITGANNGINTNSLPSGLYILIIESEKIKTKTIKFIKE